MPIEVEELVNKILKGLEESGKRYDLILLICTHWKNQRNKRR